MKVVAIARELGRSGLCVCPHFLSATGLRETRHDLQRLQAQARFSPAGIGQGAAQHADGRVRSDETYWLERGLQNRVQALLWRKLDSLQQALNQELFLGLLHFEGHYAAYPKGGFYARHRDCFSADSDRLVSVVLYLNRAWRAADGGRLRIYGADSHVDVDPVGGTMVCFMSRVSEHEVLLSHAARMSFTGWFKVRATGRDWLLRTS